MKLSTFGVLALLVALVAFWRARYGDPTVTVMVRGWPTAAKIALGFVLGHLLWP